MKKVIVFGASSSKQSINQQFAVWAGDQLGGIDIQELKISEYEAPLYSIDRETEGGIPEIIMNFKSKIEKTDGVIISLAEHNGNFTAAFKNLFDWLSRVGKSVWEDKPMLLLSTSPGGRGGKGVMAIAMGGFPHAGGNIVGSYSLPSFAQNFDNGIVNSGELAAFNGQLELFKQKFT